MRYLPTRRVLAPLAAVISRVKARPRPPAMLPAMPELLPPRPAAMITAGPQPGDVVRPPWPRIHQDHPGAALTGKHVARWRHPDSPLLHIAMIIAVDGHGVIGLDGAVPWITTAHDRFVERLTVRSPVIIGRAAWEAMIEAAGAEPILADQAPIILSRVLDPDLSILDEQTADGAVVVRSPMEALDAAACVGGVAYVLGGAQTFQTFSGLADLLYVTRIPGCFPGDVFMERAWLDGFALVDWALADDGSVEHHTYVRTRGPRDA